MRANATEDLKEAWPFSDECRHDVLDSNTEKVVLTELGALLDSIACAGGVEPQCISIKGVSEALFDVGGDEWVSRLGLESTWGRVQAIRGMLAEHNLRLVIQAARGYRSYGCTLADRIQQGNIGLLKGVDRFEPHRGQRFSTYATYWIHNEIKELIRNTVSLVRRPRHIVDQLNALHRQQSALKQSLQRDPTCRELADYCALPAEKTRKLLLLSQHPVAIEPRDGSDDEGNAVERKLFESHQFDEIPLESMDDPDISSLMSAALDPCERFILERRFGLDDGKAVSLESIAGELGWSRETVRRHQNKALDRLRAATGDVNQSC